MTKVSLYPPRALRFRGKDKVDGTIDDGGGGFDSKSLSGELLENVLAEFKDLDCQVGNEADNYVMTLVVDSGVVIMPDSVSIYNTAGSMGTRDIIMSIGTSAGGRDVMPLTHLEGFLADGVMRIPIMGRLPADNLSSSVVYYVELQTGSSGINICDIRIHGNQFDV